MDAHCEDSRRKQYVHSLSTTWNRMVRLEGCIDRESVMTAEDDGFQLVASLDNRLEMTLRRAWNMFVCEGEGGLNQPCVVLIGVVINKDEVCVMTTATFHRNC